MSTMHGTASYEGYEAAKALFEARRFRTANGKRKFHRILRGSGTLVSETKAAFTIANEDCADCGVGGAKRFLRAWFNDERARSYEYVEHSYVRRENRRSTVYYACAEPRHEALVSTSTESEKHANVEYFLDYVRLLVDDARVEWMVAWLADILVNPDDKGPCPIAVVLCGAPGSGKSSLCELMARLLGAGYVHRESFFPASFEPPARHKSGPMLKCKLFVEFEEIDFRAYRKTAGRVKAMVSERARWIEPRAADAMCVKASERVLITTSTAGKVVLDSGDPTFAAFAVSARRVGDTAYWTEHYAKLGCASYIKDVAEYLLSRKTCSRAREHRQAATRFLLARDRRRMRGGCAEAHGRQRANCAAWVEEHYVHVSLREKDTGTKLHTL